MELIQYGRRIGKKVYYVRQKPRMDSIRIVQSSVTLSFFVSIFFYCMIYREYNMAAREQIEAVRDIINTKR